MQLTFPNGEHPNVAFNYGEISVGSKAGLGVSLSGRNLADTFGIDATTLLLSTECVP